MTVHAPRPSSRSRSTRTPGSCGASRNSRSVHQRTVATEHRHLSLLGRVMHISWQSEDAHQLSDHMPSGSPRSADSVCGDSAPRNGSPAGSAARTLSTQGCRWLKSADPALRRRYRATPPQPLVGNPLHHRMMRAPAGQPRCFLTLRCQAARWEPVRAGAGPAGAVDSAIWVRPAR